VRFDGEYRDFLMDIRNGKFEYEELMTSLEEDLQELEFLKEESDLQEKVNHKDIGKLYMELVNYD
jgi:hypothetical protein